jgi:histidine kinase
MNIEKTLDIIHNRPSVRVALHLFFWVVTFAVQYYLAQISFNNYGGWPHDRVVLNIAAGVIETMIFYYPFVYWILPYFVYRKRLVYAILSLVLVLVVFCMCDLVREEMVINNCDACLAALGKGGTGYGTFLERSYPDRLLGKLVTLGSLILLIFSIAMPLGLKFGLQLLRQQIVSLKLANDNLQLEFNFLRSQVNPHFLFNTMNNIYGLIMNDEKNKSLQTVSGLTAFLRYSLYESNHQFVQIEKETSLIRNYIDLETIRLNHTSVHFEQATDRSVTLIAPLLMIPLVENAFTYTDDTPGSAISIYMLVKDGVIKFSVKNSSGNPDLLKQEGGIGLQNLKKRLELHYAGAYVYEVLNADNYYFVSLSITPDGRN